MDPQGSNSHSYEKRSKMVAHISFMKSILKLLLSRYYVTFRNTESTSCVYSLHRSLALETYTIRPIAS